jgi:hypothetical protein
MPGGACGLTPYELNETDHGHYIKISIQPNGSFTMLNERGGFIKEYPVITRRCISSELFDFTHKQCDNGV